MQASGGQLKKRLNNKTFPSEAPVNRKFKLYQGRNLMGAKISDYCMDFKKQPHLIIFIVDITAIRFLVLELDLWEKLAIDSRG